ncbi:hypothetical protein [Streptomyces sp. NPDC001568]
MTVESIGGDRGGHLPPVVHVKWMHLDVTPEAVPSFGSGPATAAG